jgi:hypothetical protein
MNDRSDLLVPRPRRTVVPAGGAASKSALPAQPATAASLPGRAWPAPLQALFARNAALPKAKPDPSTLG